jgi:Fe-S-cluster containining protein
MDHIVKKYGKFLRTSSELFAAAAKKHAVTCKRGCHECCSVGFFDITLMDALYLRSAVKKLSAPVRERILKRCEEQLDVLEKKKAFSRKDPILRTGESIDVVSRRSAKVRCPALENGVCLIYDHRPHICRIFGPTIRGKRRAVHLEGCGYFKKDIPEADLPILDNYEEEDRILLELYRAAGRKKIREVDTIIPAALTMDMKKWL